MKKTIATTSPQAFPSLVTLCQKTLLSDIDKIAVKPDALPKLTEVIQNYASPLILSWTPVSLFASLSDNIRPGQWILNLKKWLPAETLVRLMSQYIADKKSQMIPSDFSHSLSPVSTEQSNEAEDLPNTKTLSRDTRLNNSKTPVSNEEPDFHQRVISLSQSEEKVLMALLKLFAGQLQSPALPPDIQNVIDRDKDACLIIDLVLFSDAPHHIFPVFRELTSHLDQDGEPRYLLGAYTLHLAAWLGFHNIVKEFYKHTEIPINVRDSQGNVLPHIAAFKQDMKLLIFFQQQFRDSSDTFNYLNHKNELPLTLARSVNADHTLIKFLELYTEQ